MTTNFKGTTIIDPGVMYAPYVPINITIDFARPKFKKRDDLTSYLGNVYSIFSLEVRQWLESQTDYTWSSMTTEYHERLYVLSSELETLFLLRWS